MSGQRGWTLVYDGFEPAEEGLREALTTLGNGFFATRGAAEEAAADETHYPGTYVAGLYNRLATTIAGRTVTNEDLVNCPNWLPLTFRVGEDGRWFNLRALEIAEYSQTLDMRTGVLARRIAFTDPDGRRFRLATRRLVHWARPHLAAIEWRLQSPDWDGTVTVRSGLDGSVINAGVARYRALSASHLEVLAHGAAGPAAVFLVARTLQSRVEIAVAARTRLYRDGEAIAAEAALVEQNATVANDLTFSVAPDDTVRVEKIAAVYTSRDFAISEAAEEARAAAGGAPSFADLYASHARAYDALWRRADVELDGTNDEQTALRLNIFHIAQTISPGTLDRDVGVPARGLHGEAYRGHVFWDELFVFPPLTGILPELTRSLLNYRYRRLGAARRLAAAAGLKGALFPWQSGSNGAEETQAYHLNPRSGHWLADNSHLQRHVNLAIAYNVWRYYLSTRDAPFLNLYGAEIVVEIGRLFASLATFNEATGRWEITGVMGPDEYHDGYADRETPGLDNNAYTNVMAVWCFTRLLKMLELMPAAARRNLTERIGLADDEVALWEDLTRRMTVPFHGDGIISQFTGYDALEEFDWQGYREKYGDIHRLDRILEAEGDTPNRYKVSKQADVTMLFFLLPEDQLIELLERLGYAFSADHVRRNIEYYLARTSHGSTLSRVVHAALLARIDPDGAWPLFREALTADQTDAQHGTTKEGIHLGAMAGTVDILQRGFLGIERLHNRLHVNPRMPRAIRRLSLADNFRRRWFRLSYAAGRLEIALEDDGGEPTTVVVNGAEHTVAAGGRVSVAA